MRKNLKYQRSHKLLKHSEEDLDTIIRDLITEIKIDTSNFKISLEKSRAANKHTTKTTSAMNWAIQLKLKNL